MARPHEALAQARRILAGSPGPREALIAHQAAGIVLRELGDLSGGTRELRHAVTLARRLHSAEHEADVLSSLGTAFLYAGRTVAALAAFDRAVALSEGTLKGRVLHRRGNALWILGRHAAALDDFRAAVATLQRAGDDIWTARALNGRGLVNLALGHPARADSDFATAGALLAAHGQDLEVAHTVLNRGVAAFYAGDLPAALAWLENADRDYQALSVPAPALSRIRGNVLLAAGLAQDALREVDAAGEQLERLGGGATVRAELLMVAATCALAVGDARIALARARAASRLLARQQRAWLHAHAKLSAVQAAYLSGPVSRRLLAEARRAIRQLADVDSPQAEAHLVAGRIAADLGLLADAAGHLTDAARYRRRGSVPDRLSSWLAEALRAQLTGDGRQLLRSCRQGLVILDEYRWSLGASELRAQATAYGTELAVLAQRYAVRSGKARLLLQWSERWRATAMAVPAVRPPNAAGFDTDLAALRSATTDLETARRQGDPSEQLERQQLRLEKRVREASLRTRGEGRPVTVGVDPAELLAELGERQLAEIVEVDGTLHVLLCASGRVRLLTAGSTADAMRAADFARFALRRLARAGPGTDGDSALAILAAAGPRLQSAILGPAASQLKDGPLVVVPPGKLHAIPWALLPALTDRPFSVAPSASAWLRAHATPPPGRRHVVLATGPGLVTGGAEVPAVARLHGDATILTGTDATAGRLLTELDGAWLAHIAAHGSFRSDSPMFSSLRLHDGPLTVYDFEQLQRAPYRLVLPSCDSGVLAPAGADELLGLVSSLLPLGTAGVVASVVPVNDHAVVPLMVELHRQLAGGASLSAGLLQVRSGASADPAEQAAAMSLVMLGAG